MQVSDDICIGPVYANFLAKFNAVEFATNPSPMERGIGPVGRVLTYSCVPAALVATGLAAAQAVGAAGNLTLAGSLTSGGTWTSDVACGRAISITSSDAGDTTQTALVTGTDFLGVAMSESIAFNGAATVNGKKAFYTVTSIAISAALTGNGSAGTLDILGLPVAITDRTYMLGAQYNNTLARDTGTLVVAVATDPATTTTGDVRGTYALSGAADASKRLTLTMILKDNQVGPAATYAGAFGVTQA